MKQQTTLAEILGFEPMPYPRVYGIEVEVERAGQMHSVKGWSIAPDGSLRNNGAEYIFDGPRSYSSSIERVKALGDMFAKHANAEHYVHTTRTSVHIHANCTDFSLPVLQKLARIYTLVEAAAFAKWGQGRDATPYCIPLHTSEVYLHDLLHHKDLGLVVRCFHGRATKYSAFSLCRIRDLGTVEFRMFNGTNSTEVILEYLLFVHSLMEHATTDIPEQDAAFAIAEVCGLLLDPDEINLALSVMSMLSITPTTCSGIFQGLRSSKALKGAARVLLLTTGQINNHAAMWAVSPGPSRNIPRPERGRDSRWEGVPPEWLVQTATAAVQQTDDENVTAATNTIRNSRP